MSKRRILVAFIAVSLTFGVTAMWSAATIERDGDTEANVLEDSGSVAGNVGEKKGGNKVAKVLAAPFKLFGKIFGHKSGPKLERMTAKDAEKFVSVGVTRVDNRLAEQPNVDPTADARQHLANGRAALLKGRLNEAITELSTAVSLDPKLSEAQSLLGVAYDQKGLADRAKEAYERAIKAEPDDAQTLNNLGFSLYRNGNYRAAIDRLKRAAKLAPGDERILNNLALALCRVSKFEEAYKSFTRAGGPVKGALNTAMMMERFALEDEAIKYYERAHKVDPSNQLALRRLADLYQRTGRVIEAQAARNDLAAASTVAVSQ
jgi:Flp pilus assembly protein TadD